MKVVLVTHYYSTHRGGIELVAGELARRLAGAHEILWIASDCDPVPAPGAGALHCLPMRATNAIERLSGLPLPLWGPRSCARLWRAVRDADVVHLHDFVYPGNCLAFLAARVHGKPVVVTQHVGAIPYRNPILRLVQWTAHATLGRAVLGGADRVVFVSTVVRDYFAARSVRFRQPPVVVPNGVDTDTFAGVEPGGRAAARAALGLDPRRPVLLFVGRFVEKKGLHILEALARRMTDVTWILAGWGPIDPRQWNAPNVHVHDNRRGHELVPLYHAADALVLPSVGEGLPLVVQEALSCGTPVMVGEDTAAAVNGPPQVVLSCRVGEDTTATAEAWEAGLRRALDEWHAQGSPAREALAFARASWSWASCAGSYASLLAQFRAPARIP